jgi:predicted nucleic acid-binding protein
VRTALDINVLSALWSAEPLASEVSRVLDEAHDEGGLVVSAPVYAELVAHPKATQPFVEEFLSATRIEIDFLLDEEVWREAALRFAGYAARRRASRGGSAKRLLVDFLVGAHALIRADRLLTLDASRYTRDFPELKIATA